MVGGESNLMFRGSDGLMGLIGDLTIMGLHLGGQDGQEEKELKYYIRGE